MKEWARILVPTVVPSLVTAFAFSMLDERVTLLAADIGTLETGFSDLSRQVADIRKRFEDAGEVEVAPVMTAEGTEGPVPPNVIWQKFPALVLPAGAVPAVPAPDRGR